MFRHLPIQSPASLLLALGSLFAGAVLAVHHPLWPMAAMAAFWLTCISLAWRPGIWLFLVPALLPVLNFSPWSGWIIFEEFDLLLLAVLAGGYAHRATSGVPRTSAVRRSAAFWLIPVLLGVSGVSALLRGFADAGGFRFNWFASYNDSLNSLRIFKSLAFALLLWPLLSQELSHSNTRAHRRLACGVLTGLAAVTVAIAWERMVFPGFLNFSAPYRTVALFWEMHVGGGAIDAYLALSTPFVVWALVSAKRPFEWLAAAVLALLTGYACLTTFSRGVYLAVASSLLLLYLLLLIQRRGVDVAGWWMRVVHDSLRQGWRAKAGLLLVIALLLEVAAVLGGGTFMKERLSRVTPDFGSRIEHWQQGLGFLQGEGDWWLGKGLGRVPAHFAQAGPESEFSGSVKFAQESRPSGEANSFVIVSGPPSRRTLGGGYALTQRVGSLPEGALRVSFDIRVDKQAEVYVDLCQRHLLYDGRCQRAMVAVWPVTAGWQRVSLPLVGPHLGHLAEFLARPVLFSLAVVNAGGVAEIDNISMNAGPASSVVKNGNFSETGAHWLPMAQSYFIPWHLDSLFIEHLVERGVFGLLFFLLLVAFAIRRLVLGPARHEALSPYLAASLFSVLVVGLTSSVMDAPRVALMLYLMVFYSSLITKGEVDR
ncbi:hypothetical protein [Rhodoferax sp. PAMC 29310]|uniref:hypothetical protein n=1 Tax=Rhodoferax sp. PAMC 29310 TaxID=2822760 RepID=UPI001B326CB1|nr:hypothetical protein [Rhodoferax sp. PAMC 29310]